MEKNTTAAFLKNSSFFNEKLFLILVLFVSFIIRIFLFKYRSLPEGDGCHYVSFAKDYMRGDFYTSGTYWSIGWPGLIALFSLIFRTDVELSARLLNALFGTGLIAASYFFAKRFFNQRIARYAALLMAVNLYLVNFSTYCLTECLYTLLIIFIVFLGWVSLEKQKKRYYFYLGALLGFSYTVRNEAMAFVLIFLGMMVGRNYKKAWLNILVLLLGLALFLVPLTFFYHHYFGRWTLGDKGFANFAFGEDSNISYRAVAELTDDFSENLYLKSIKDEIRRTNIFAYLYKNKFFVDRLARSYKRVLLYLPSQFLAIPFLGPVLFWLFFLLGSYACLLKNKGWRIKYLYLLLFPALALTLVALCFVEERKTTPFIPIFILIISAGIYHLETLFHSRKARFIYYSLCIIVFTVSSASAFEKAKTEIIGDGHLLMKEAGLWMRANLSQSGRTMLWEPVMAYYFYEKTPNNLAGLPYAKDYETLLRKMRFDQAKYLVIFNWEAPDNPAIDYLMKHTETPELELLKTFSKDTLEARVYQLR
jgi:4-amino-4-deoxy-L-arabinose transferase-like glycosyltransferase